MFRLMPAMRRARATPFKAASARAWVLSLLMTMLMVMLLAQCAGLLHAVVHGGAGRANVTASAVHDQAPATLAGAVAADAPDGSGWGHAAGDADCQLWDQLLSQHAACTATAGKKPPAPLAQAIAAADTTARRHGPVAFYRSRAPPVT